MVGFLVRVAPLFGFAGYSVFVVRGVVSDRDGVLASVVVDPYEKVLRVSLFPGFFVVGVDRLNVLVHELVHARVVLYRMKFDSRVSMVEYEEEEDCVNDLTRGVLSFRRFRGGV